jgi:hypothetical protein
MAKRSFSALHEIQIDGRVDLPPSPHAQAPYFPKMHLIEILIWPFVVVETSKKAHSIGNLEG